MIADMDVSMKSWYLVSAGLRLGLVAFGEWQDRTMPVKYTDVDYYVFSDAASFVAKGKSPYSRSTFRYTPLLAWVLTPNAFLSAVFGKLFFITFDILAGHLIFTILKQNSCSDRTAKLSSLLWLLNPLPMTVSSRGNADSILAFLVLQTISLLQTRQITLAGLMYALTIHLRIYTVTYALPVYLYLGQDQKVLEQKSSESLLELKFNSKHFLSFVHLLKPTWNQVKFGLVTAATLCFLTIIFYMSYGWPFLYETYLYHIIRRDIRHNFSPYFYMLYLTANDEETSTVLKLLSFLPQILLLTAVALRFSRDIPLCWFLCTYIFVMLNKVCTSQYFLWYLCLLPLLVPRLHLSKTKIITMGLLWFLAQGLWLLPAYYLEFEGQDTFLLIWLAGLFFFLVNTYIVYIIITHYEYS